MTEKRSIATQSLTGEDRGEGDQAWQRPLSLALEERGYARSASFKKHNVLSDQG
jgi:hypothetical protein